MKLSQSSGMKFIGDAFYHKKPAINNITSLYSRHEDEPDFDCEFLYGDGIESRGNENILDPDPDDYIKNGYNDSRWNADVFNPYVEQTYY
ncbi:hypothetical protein [Flavobacterium ginsengiterrae]|uniref:Uncharacterized protein n=1 Tax=Flavobacterium ginsengiterrae TaxID=871695 RepID=A0ABP7G7L3_9FLAO